MLQRLVYRVDLESQYADLKEAYKFNEQSHGRSKRAGQQYDKQSDRLDAYHHMTSPALVDHIRRSATDDVVFSMPVQGETLSFLGLSDFMNQGGSGINLPSVCSPLDDDGIIVHDSAQQVFFKVTHTSPASWQRLRLAPGASQGFRSTDLAITIHESWPCSGASA